MKHLNRSTAILVVLAVLVASVSARVAGTEFLPAAAHEIPATGVALADSLAVPTPADALSIETAAIAPALVAETPVAVEVPSSTVVTSSAQAETPPPAAAPAATPSDAVATSAAPTSVAQAPVAAAPAPVAQAPVAPAPVAPAPVAPAPVAPAPLAPVATPFTCPATWFCYPRLGIAGPIVPYSDCSGTTDIGTSIRSFACLSPFYLMGHAYTQFGLITQWRAGDVVFASGRQFTLNGAFTQSSCAAPARAIAPLSLQTSLTSGGCGSVLVVQGN